MVGRALRASRKGNDALAVANGVCASPSAPRPRQWFSNDLPLICATAIVPCAPCARTNGEPMLRTWQTRSKNGEAQGWLRKESCEAPAFHKPLGHREICAKHSANGKPNALPWMRAQGMHSKTVYTQTVFKAEALPNTESVEVGEPLHYHSLRLARRARPTMRPRRSAALPLVVSMSHVTPVGLGSQVSCLRAHAHTPPAACAVRQLLQFMK